MKNMRIGVHIALQNIQMMNAPSLIDGIVAADRDGLDTAWLTVGGPAPTRSLSSSAPPSRARNESPSAPRSCPPTRATQSPWFRAQPASTRWPRAA